MPGNLPQKERFKTMRAIDVTIQNVRSPRDSGIKSKEKSKMEVVTMDKNFGEKLRAARLVEKVALKDLAAKCGLSYSYISQVERGEASPSLSALDRLAKALGTTVWELLRDESSEASQSNGQREVSTQEEPRMISKSLPGFMGSKIVRKNGRRTVILPHSHVQYQMITPNLISEMQLLIMEAEAGTNSGDQPFEHRGEECCVVLQGTVEMTVGNETFVLEKDDSVYFSSEQSHRWRNAGEGKLVLLLACTPPAY
jgi:transcriptional regulator with XRE-family HTH domain